MELGTLLPSIVTEPPGPAARAWLDRLARVECPAITARRDARAAAPGGRDPIVWAEARGANVRDSDGNVYVDLSAGFSVAGVGHAHPRVVEAAERQLRKLIHGMGDLFPSEEKVRLAERLDEVTPAPLQKSIFASSGSEAVEAALKTALIATGRRRVLGFSAGYHGMSLGALGVSGYRDSFRRPFASMAGAVELRLPWANCASCALGRTRGDCALACVEFIDRIFASDVAGSEDVAAIIVEPLLGRGGVVDPPPGWLPRLRELTRRRGILLILDEIFTGFGRTGQWFACEQEQVVPDILVVGKAMGGGFPISAAIGTPEVMGGWGRSGGESIHTSTFLGNPLGCAMALAAIEAIRDEALVARAASLGARIRAGLEASIGGHPRVAGLRGRGLMIGVALLDPGGSPWTGGAVRAMHDLLGRGWIVTPAGAAADVICLTPPFVLTDAQADAAVEALSAWVRAQTA